MAISHGIYFLSASLTAILMAILSCQFSWPLSSHDRAIGQRNFRATHDPTNTSWFSAPFP